MNKQKPRIIKDCKQRGEWAESVFVARATGNGLAVSKPWGESSSYDCVVGGPGKFVAVQVKCTVAKTKNGEGYICTTRSDKIYRAGAFDFLAAYVVPEDAWYIVPAKEIRGMRAISLCTEGNKYEGYREAWHLLREAAGLGRGPEPSAAETDAVGSVQGNRATALGRMEAAMNFFQRQLERRGDPRKRSDDG